MEAVKELTPEQICNDILQNHPAVTEFDLCDDGQCFIEYSERLHKNIRSYVKFSRNGEARTILSTNNTAVNIVMELLKKKVITRSDARNIAGEACDKCGGLGFLSHFAHVESGLCFKCNGTGTK